MKTEFIVAKADKSWETRIVEIPEGTIPDKLHVGSAKWQAKAVTWFEDEYADASTFFVGILKAEVQ